MTFLTVLKPKVSVVNSTTTPLGAGATFTGTFENVTNFDTITVFIFTDQDSDNPDGVIFQFSPDGVNADSVRSEVVLGMTSGGGKAFSLSVIAPFFRVVYNNNSTTPQTVFRMTSLCNPYKDTFESQTTVPAPTTTDAFGRQKVSNPQTLLDTKFINDNDPLSWDQALAGGGTAVQSTGYITCTSPSGGSVLRQSRVYTPYQPGKGLQILLTGVLETGGGVADVVSRIGYFDDNNGHFFQLDGTTLSVVERSNVTGPVVDTIIPQSSWNVDKMDGSGPSGITIDPSIRQIFSIELEWLGVGTAVFGIIIRRVLYFVHIIQHTNTSFGGTSTLPYTSTPTLPVRYQIISSGANAGEMIQICATVISDGGFSPIGHVFSIGRGTGNGTYPNGVTQAGTLAISTTELPVLSLRLNNTGIRTLVKILGAELVLTSGGVVSYRLYRFIPPNSAVLTGAVWTSVESRSQVEYDTTASAINTTNPTPGPIGNLIFEGFISNQTRFDTKDLADIFSAIILGDISGTSDLFVLSAQTVSGNNNITASLHWQEVY